MVKNVGKMVQKYADGASYYEASEFNSDLNAKLPERFSAKDLPQFKATDDPRFHLRGFIATLALQGVDPALYPTVFPLSLELVCQKWFFSLPEKDTSTWEDLTHAFITRYRGNIQIQTSTRELEIMKQRENEGFTAFLTRLRQTAAQMVSPPPESEMVKTFINNLQPKYRTHLRYIP